MRQYPGRSPEVSSFVGTISRTVRNYFAGSYQIRILLGALYALIIADGIITRFLVTNGFAFEGNPFLQFWVHQDSFLTLKILGGLLAACYLWDAYRRRRRLTVFCSSLFLTAYTAIVFWNVLILL